MKYEEIKILAPYPQPHLAGGFARLQQRFSVDIVPFDNLNLKEMLPHYDAYFATLACAMTPAMAAASPRLKVVATPSTGVDHLPLHDLAARHIPVITLREYPQMLTRVTSTAEHAWALLLALMRQLPDAVAAVRNGSWPRNCFLGHQLSGKTLGILGYGRLGKMVAEYGKAFGMNVIWYDTDANVHAAPGTKRVSEEELLSSSDILSIHIHLTEANRSYLNAARMDKMKPAAIIVNTSRGAVIDEPELVRRLENARLGGIAADVIDGEWSEVKNNPLVKYARAHHNAVLTPHCGGVTEEAQFYTLSFIADRLYEYLMEKVIKDVEISADQTKAS